MEQNNSECRGNQKSTGPITCLILTGGLIFIAGVCYISNNLEKRMIRDYSSLPKTNVVIMSNQRIIDISNSFIDSERVVWRAKRRVLRELNPGLEKLSTDTYGTNGHYIMHYDPDFLREK